MRKTGFLLSLCVFMTCWLPSAFAEFTIEITQGVDNPTRIAISPMTLGGRALPEDISNIVSADLDRSGLFNSIPRPNMLSFPARENDVYLRYWRVPG